MEKYNPADIEKRWQKYWAKQKFFEVKEDLAKQKFYALIEFPYPSGAGLHVGHLRPFTAMDVIARKKRMEGFNVLYPIGFDAFGLPTENYAIKTGRPPAEVTQENITTFTRQLRSLGYSFDWSRVVDTTDPGYYRWTQWIFLQFFKHGLAYKKNQPINWCPKDKIGLANEEVVAGCCERCGSPVERRDKEQWMLAITKYAAKLLEGLKEVNYITPARVQQEHWIGKSEGAVIDFKIKNQAFRIKVFTTRPDTLFGVTYVVLAPEHELLNRLKTDIKNWTEIEEYLQTARLRPDIDRFAEGVEKSGVQAQGIIALNPANDEELPIWVADYVVSGYGTDAVMAVPAHDERDFAFAQKYGLPIKQVIAPTFIDPVRPPEPAKKTQRRRTVHAIVRRPSDGYILMLQWKGAVWGASPPRTFIIGGIEEGEEAALAAQREIMEETGYSTRFVKEIGLELQTQYHAAHKNENRQADIQVLHFEVDNEQPAAVAEMETAKHDPVWVAPDQVATFTNVVDGPFVWRWFSGGRRVYTDSGVLIHSNFFNDLITTEAAEKIIQWLEEQGIGRRQVNYKLRDWVFSRQRYWGEPIPLVNCASCGWVALPEDQLPLKLPAVKKYEPTDTGESPLSAMEKWVNTNCPQCGGQAKRETDTMPNWAGSSWYFLRYCDPHNNQELASSEKLKYWLGSLNQNAKSGDGGVDWYNGGMEHTVLHLLYSRFWNQFLFDIGVIPNREPYQKRTSHGMILGPDGEKMSKSRGNVINPDEMVEQFGADALRIYVLFMGPFDQAVTWDTNGLVGVRRFLERVWSLRKKVVSNNSPSRLSNGNANNIKSNIGTISLLHRTIKKVTEHIDAMRFNTAIAALMELVNEMSKEETIAAIDYQLLIKLLSPFAPHIAEELWNTSDNSEEKNGASQNRDSLMETLTYSSWPVYDPVLAQESTMTIAVQVNGKVRDQLEMSVEVGEDEIKSLALGSAKVQKWLEGKEPKKFIYIKGKLLSIVV